MSRFNLIDEKWIPVRFLDGSRDELGIRDTLLRAKEIAAIEDSSPLVVTALHRFLLAVLYRALEGPADIEQAKALFKEGLPSEKITAYLEKWRDRFWLFDEKYPFGQIPTFEPKTWRAWTALAAEHNADNAKVLFDHVDVEAPGTITEAAAARWILATQTFSVSCGKSELSHTGTAPSATAAMALPLGNDFQDTLLLSLVPQNRAVIAADLPLWERSPESVASLKAGFERAANGLADKVEQHIRRRRHDRRRTRIAEIALDPGILAERRAAADAHRGIGHFQRRFGCRRLDLHHAQHGILAPGRQCGNRVVAQGAHHIGTDAGTSKVGADRGQVGQRTAQMLQLVAADMRAGGGQRRLHDAERARCAQRGEYRQYRTDHDVETAAVGGQHRRGRQAQRLCGQRRGTVAAQSHAVEIVRLAQSVRFAIDQP